MFPLIFQTSLPVAFGYVPLGMAFGVLMTGTGCGWWWAPVMGVVIYAGSAQFLAVGLLSAGAGAAEAFFAALLLNFRHVFYGLAMRDRYRSLGAARVYAVFGLTDETFSLLAGLPPRESRDPEFVLGVTALNQFWWVLGCVLGALAGGALPFSTQGLAFALTALFAVLLVEQLLRGADWAALAGAAVSAALCLLFAPKYFLLASIAMSALLLIVLPRKRGETA